MTATVRGQPAQGGPPPSAIVAEWSSGSSLGSYPLGRGFESLLRNHTVSSSKGKDIGFSSR